MSFNLCLLGHSEALLPICPRSSTLPARPPAVWQTGHSKRRPTDINRVGLTSLCAISRRQPNSQQSNKFETSKLPGVPAFTDILQFKASDPRACTSISGSRSMLRCSRSTYNFRAAGIVLMEPGDTDREAGGGAVVHPGETCGLRKLELLVAGGDGALSSNEIKSLFSVLCGRYVVPAFERAGECADLCVTQ